MFKNKLFLFFFIPVVLLITGCGPDDMPEKTAGPPVKVNVISITPQSSPVTHAYSGTIEPIERVRLATRISGWIESINFAEGELVAKDVVIVTMQNEDIKAKLAQANAGINAAQAQYDNTSTNLKRIEALYAKGAATQKELDDIRTAYTAAESQLKTANEVKREVSEMFGYTVLKAPFPGVITRKFMEEGDLANPGQPVIVLENLDRVKVVAKVPETQISALKTGMNVNVVVSALENGTLEGQIDRIVPAADPMSRQFEIHVLIDNPDQTIKSGQFARVMVEKEGQSAILVPHEAVFQRGQLQGLYVVNDQNLARLRWIRSGRMTAEQIEILSGLNVGDRVVIAGYERLVDGQAVEVSE